MSSGNHLPAASAYIDWPLVVAWLLVLGFGFVMVVSATVAKDLDYIRHSASVAMNFDYLIRHGFYLGIALVGFLIVLTIPLSFWRRYRKWAWIVAAALCAIVLVPAIGLKVNGARRWIDMGVVTVQPSEFVRLLFLVYLAGFLARYDDVLKENSRVLIGPFLVLALVLGLLVTEDMGTVVVVAATAGALFFVAGMRLRLVLPLVLVCALLFAVFTIFESYRLERLLSYTDPWAKEQHGGYQLVQAFIGFGRGELFGHGLGAGVQKLDYLPAAHNDFIFAVVGEELGFLGALALIVLLGILVQRSLSIGRGRLKDGDKFSGYLCYGVGILIGVQALINLGVASGLLPTKGMTLPFVSYGGNSLVVCCVLIGLVCRAKLEERAR